MKILIGTPIHVSKDYCMERWLKNVSELKYPADLLLVDNSPDLNYVERVKNYLKKYGVNNYKMKHLEIPQGKEVNKSVDEQIHERVARCQEIIRQEILAKDYDAWFSWECDQLIPTNALDKLIEIMKTGDFIMVNHNSWNRDVPGEINTDFGVSLVKRECLEKYGFLLQPETEPDMPDNWYSAQWWYKRRLLKNGYKFGEVYGVIEPIYHLSR